MHTRGLLPIALALFVVLAGCTVPFAETDADAGPVGDGDEADGAEPSRDGDADERPEIDGPGDVELTDAERERLRTDDLPTDEVAVYRRVAALLGSNASAPEVTARNLTEEFAGLYRHTEDPRFQRLDLTEVRVEGSGVGGISYVGEVAIHVGDGNASEVEVVLAHEFVHTIQYRDEMVGTTGAGIPGWEDADDDHLDATDADLARTALVEGAAVYVEDEYAKRHLGLDRPSDRMREAYREEPPGMRYVFGPYAFGAPYANATLDDPADLPSLYRDDPPVTTHAIMYPEEGVDEPEGVAVEAETGDDLDVTRTDRMGAMVLHAALGAHLSEADAHEAARAWRDDRLVEFADGQERPFVWTIRLADGAAANRTATLFERSLDARTDGYADEFAVERVGDRTVAVVSGDAAFRDRIEVAVEGDEVTVRTDRPTAGGRPTAGVVGAPSAGGGVAPA